MRKYKIRLHHEQLQYLYNSLESLFQNNFILDNIDEVCFYNIKSFIKTLHTKLYNLNFTNIDKGYQYGVSIDLNQHKALSEVYALAKETIDNNMYLQIVYWNIFTQCDKQRIDLMERHKYFHPPTALISHKLKIDESNS